MDLNKLHSPKRSGKVSNTPGIRTEYQRDFDRLIFSSPFRRLQNKTQVFPLPGSSFVHNRLTHSLEVASVGRSLGRIVGENIVTGQYESHLNDESKEFYKYNLSEVLAASCLAHDIGNPAFGHSGEKAISNYFKESTNLDMGIFSKEQQEDLLNFEGNANAIRILTSQFNGRLIGGYRVTYTTLATILKYPCESTGMDDVNKHRKKYGFFQSEKELIKDIANELELKIESTFPLCYSRHPFVYLLEAADDICYRVIDFEDGHRLGIISDKIISDCFFKVIECINFSEDNIDEIKAVFASIKDNNEKIGYLRSRLINTLTHKSAQIFNQNLPVILNGEFNSTLVDEIENICKPLEEIRSISTQKLYNHQTVVELEMAGYNVMYQLLDAMIPAALKDESKRSHLERKALNLAPEQFHSFSNDKSPYARVMGILDFVSGMTDLYATELYRKIKGIEIGKHS